MKILALDTATESCSVALGIDDAVIDRSLELGRGHAEQILPMIDALLAEAGVALTALDAIAFGRGPGGFTGVRLAASVTQGLAFGAGLGVVPISDLAAVAQQALDLVPTARWQLAVNDARMREVYWGCFRTGDDGLVVASGDEQVSPPGDVVIPPSPADAGLVAGRGLVVFPELASRGRDAGAQVFPDLLPRAREILALARPAVAAGELLSAERALPVYVRDRVVATGPS